MALEYYITKGKEKLRCGYTTGSCATLAAKAGARMLLANEVVTTERILTPKGIAVAVDICDIGSQKDSDTVRCAVQKDGGDDWDATHGIYIYAVVKRKKEKGIDIDGGIGVGRVTKKGLDQPVGEAAINHIPREMMVKEIENLAQQYGYEGGFSIRIEVPEGEEIAKKTFNPQIGIVGGISIIGTTGIVEPQSVKALIDTIETEMKMHHENEVKKLILTPGNYGETFINQYPIVEDVAQVKISNYLGEALDFGAAYGYEEVLLVGHIGKMVKVAGGIMNTHSRYADCRNEIFAAYAALNGVSQNAIKEIMESSTTDYSLEILEREGMKEQVMAGIVASAQKHLDGRVASCFRIGIVMFSNVYGIVGMSEEGRRMLESWSRNYK